MSARIFLTIVIASILGTTYVNRHVVVEALLSVLPYVWVALVALVCIAMIIAGMVNGQTRRF